MTAATMRFIRSGGHRPPPQCNAPSAVKFGLFREFDPEISDFCQILPCNLRESRT